MADINEIETVTYISTLSLQTMLPTLTQESTSVPFAVFLNHAYNLSAYLNKTSRDRRLEFVSVLHILHILLKLEYEPLDAHFRYKEQLPVPTFNTIKCIGYGLIIV